MERTHKIPPLSPTFARANLFFPGEAMHSPIKAQTTFRNPIAVSLLVLGLAATSTIHAQGELTVEERVGRLETVAGAEALVELLRQAQRLEREVREVRGELEVQAHELSQLKRRQRELYLDIDRRVNGLETARPAPVTERTATPDASPVTAEADPGEEREAYQSAFNLLKAGRYEDAAVGFSEFLSAYPSGEYSDNAQYWLGEVYYVTRAFGAALEEFEELVRTRPGSAKLSHALLKIGYIQDELGEKEAAVRTLTDLMERFPTTTAARLAQERLRQIQ